MNPAPASRLRIGLLLIGVLAVSFSAIIIRWSEAPAAVLGMYRLLMTDLLLLPFLLPRLPEIRRVSRRDKLLVLLSGAGLGLHFLLWIESLKWTSVASSTVLLTLQPIFVAAGALFVFREKTSPAMRNCTLLALIGAVAVGWGDFRFSGRALHGDLLSVLGTASVAVYMLAGQALRSRMSTYVYSFFVFLIAGVLLGVYNLATSTDMVRYAAREWGLFALLAVIPTIFGHMLFNWLLKYLNATTISFTILGEPVGASLLAYALLGESMSKVQLAGSALLIFAVWAFLRYGRSHPAEKQGHPEPIGTKGQNLS